MQMIDDVIVNKFWRRHKILMNIGIKLGLVRAYNEYFLEKLRDVYYGGISASILLLSPYSCREKCYDRAVLACFAFKDIDYQVVHADIDTIRYNLRTIEEINYWVSKGEKINEHYANHCFVEFKNKGITWVLDTSDGLIYEKSFYYLINRPVITCIRTKQETQAFPDYIDIANTDLERDKWATLFTLPFIEAQIEKSSMYKEFARKEIKLFKQKIDYENLKKQNEFEKKQRM